MESCGRGRCRSRRVGTRFGLGWRLLKTVEVPLIKCLIGRRLRLGVLRRAAAAVTGINAAAPGRYVLFSLGPRRDGAWLCVKLTGAAQLILQIAARRGTAWSHQRPQGWCGGAR